MTKYLFSLSAILFFPFTFIAQTGVPTKVQSATIFPNGAEIIRTVDVSLIKGENTIEFLEIESQINNQTLVVSSNKRIAILTSTHANKVRGKKYQNSAHWKILDSIEYYKKQSAMLSSIRTNYNNEKKMILVNQKVSGNQSGLKVENLENLANFYRTRLNDIDNKVRVINEKTYAYNLHKNRLNQKLLKQGYTGTIGVITSTIISDKAQVATIQLKYNVNTVYWQPYYDINAVSLNQPLIITTKAKVMQNTGVHWNKVNITLSTTLPTVYGVKPIITPWILKYHTYRTKTGKADGNNRTMTYKFLDKSAYTSNSLSNKEYTEIQNNIIAKEYQLSIPYSISNKGTAVMELEEKEAVSEFYYYAAPKVDKKVYLLADVSEWEKLDLIQGQANVYLQGKFMGTTFIDPNSTKDTLSLMIGQDQELQTDRKKVDELCKKSTFGGNKKTEMAMEIIVKNNKDVSVKIILEDQVPISYTEKIEVTVEDVSNAKRNKETGLLTWEFTLAPNKSEKKIIKYMVKHPKNKPINL